MDFVKTYMWWSPAEANGDKDAAKHLDILSEQLTPEQLSGLQALAIEMWEEHNN